MKKSPVRETFSYATYSCLFVWLICVRISDYYYRVMLCATPRTLLTYEVEWLYEYKP